MAVFAFVHTEDAGLDFGGACVFVVFSLSSVGIVSVCVNKARRYGRSFFLGVTTD